MSHLAEPEVLAVGAARLAATKEDRARAARPADRRLLAPVDVPRADDDLRPRMARAGLAGDAVHWAVLRADRAAAQQLPGRVGAFGQFARFIQGDVASVSRHGCNCPN